MLAEPETELESDFFEEIPENDFINAVSTIDASVLSYASSTDDIHELSNIASEANGGRVTRTAEVTGRETENDENGQTWNKYAVTFSVNYKIDQSMTNTYLKDNPTVWFEMGEDILINENQSGTFPSQDGVFPIAGDFYIDASTRKVTITFKPDYLEYVSTQSLNGTFSFNAWIKEMADQINDKSVSLAGDDVSVPVKRYEYKPDLTVTKTYNQDFFTSEANKATFAINVSSQNGVDGSPLYLTDTLSSQQMEFDFTANSTVNLGNGMTGTVTSIETNEETGTQTAVIAVNVATDTPFNYTWQCPIKMKDNANSNADDKISAVNDVNASAGTLTSNASANFNINTSFIVAPKLIQFNRHMIGLKMPILRCFMKSSFSSVSRISARYSSICRP